MEQRNWEEPAQVGESSWTETKRRFRESYVRALQGLPPIEWGSGAPGGNTSAMDAIALVPATVVSFLVVLPRVGLSLELRTAA